ncbi:MAG: hypothetical protein EPN55_06485 [Gammaproteobacteria bacterium]|nr:MAG: hypothetical protein EPN55_06485 [Gammaproteobacteria bacterium]
MSLLIDTDVFCVLAAGQLLDDTVGLLGSDLSECARLPALSHMLRKGKLRKKYGDRISDQLIPIADSIPVIDQPDALWLDRLTLVQNIDPGEAQLFALAAEKQLSVITGDKRALRALKGVPSFADALAGRIVVLEAILIALCARLGTTVVSARVQPLVTHDSMIRVSFSPSNPDPEDALLSYYQNLVTELNPLVLWHP